MFCGGRGAPDKIQVILHDVQAVRINDNRLARLPQLLQHLSSSQLYLNSMRQARSQTLFCFHNALHYATYDVIILAQRHNDQ